MKKRTYFDTHVGKGWPDQNWLANYFLTSAGRRRFFADGNDSWGLKVEGFGGTEHLPYNERIDIDLTIQGHPVLGILLMYHRISMVDGEEYYSKGDIGKLHEWHEAAHGDLMPVGLYIPFEVAWKAIKEFMETDGALPKCITWIASADLPAGTFPGPARLP